jgi:hypothetical protein
VQVVPCRGLHVGVAQEVAHLQGVRTHCEEVRSGEVAQVVFAHSLPILAREVVVLPDGSASL